MIELTGLLGLLFFMVELWAVISVVGSDAGAFAKVAWVLILLLLPVLGFLIWVLAGPRAQWK
jgi:hypothetical protein